MLNPIQSRQNLHWKLPLEPTMMRNCRLRAFNDVRRPHRNDPPVQSAMMIHHPRLKKTHRQCEDRRQLQKEVTLNPGHQQVGKMFHRVGHQSRCQKRSMRPQAPRDESMEERFAKMEAMILALAQSQQMVTQEPSRPSTTTVKIDEEVEAAKKSEKGSCAIRIPRRRCSNTKVAKDP